ncbi:MAG: acyloxyacyl hydrolase, partial [Stellaceae bacterium]
AILFAVASLGASSAHADDLPLLALGVGAFDFDHLHPATEFRAEYRFAQGLFFIHPMLGAFVTTDSTVYAYGGFLADFVFFDHYVLMPSAAVGYYHQGNSAKNLGSRLEFKTGAEFAYRFDTGMRLGIAFDHISNAGLTRVNPGTEELLLVLSLPLPW